MENVSEYLFIYLLMYIMTYCYYYVVDVRIKSACYNVIRMSIDYLIILIITMTIINLLFIFF